MLRYRTMRSADIPNCVDIVRRRKRRFLCDMARRAMCTEFWRGRLRRDRRQSVRKSCRRKSPGSRRAAPGAVRSGSALL